jgi:hypothetical protein
MQSSPIISTYLGNSIISIEHVVLFLDEAVKQFEKNVKPRIEAMQEEINQKLEHERNSVCPNKDLMRQYYDQLYMLHDLSCSSSYASILNNHLKFALFKKEEGLEVTNSL